MKKFLITLMMLASLSMYAQEATQTKSVLTARGKVVDIYDATKINDTLKNYLTISGLKDSIGNVALRDRENTFMGKNSFSDTVLVPSQDEPFMTMNSAENCNMAVSFCDVKLLFDSLTRRVDDLERLINRMMDASKPKFDDGVLAMLVEDGSVTITAPLLTGAGDPELVAEICAFSDSACTTIEGCTSAALSGVDIVGTFSSLGCGTHFIRAVATNSKGSDTAYFKAFILMGQIVADQASDGKIYICGSGKTFGDYHFISDCSEISPENCQYEWTVDGMVQSSTTQDMTVEFILPKEYEIVCTATNKTNSAYKTVSSVKHTVVINAGTEMIPSLVVGTDDVHGTAKVVYQANVNNIVWYNDKGSRVGSGLTCSDTGSYKVSAFSTMGCKVTKNVKIRKVLTSCSVAEVRAKGETADQSHEHLKAGTTNEIDSVYDYEGNAYGVVEIGGQCWMRQNMKSVTRPSSGATMNIVTANGTGSSYSPVCYVNLTSTGCADFYERYGVLYNCAAAMDLDNSSTSSQPALPRRGICPAGWHVPSDAEFSTLATSALASVPESPAPSPAFSSSRNVYEGTNTRIATVLAGGHDWKYDPTKANNTGCDYEDEYRDAVHFSALPARSWGGGSFKAVTENAGFWPATQTGSTNAWIRYVPYASKGLGRDDANKAGFACSVRCVRD